MESRVGWDKNTTSCETQVTPTFDGGAAAIGEGIEWTLQVFPGFRPLERKQVQLVGEGGGRELPAIRAPLRPQRRRRVGDTIAPKKRRSETFRRRIELIPLSAVARWR